MDVAYSNALPCEITGRVLAPSGKPLAGAKLLRTPNDCTGWEEASGEDGEFRLTMLPSGDFTLTACLLDVGWGRVEGIHTSPEATPRVEIGMHPWSSVRGRVIDERGMPVRDAEVALWGADFTPHQRFNSEDQYARLLGMNRFAATAGTARTDAAGNFVVTNLLEGAHDLHVKREEYHTEKLRFEAARGRETRLPDIVLKRAFEGFGTLVVKVLDPAGNPMPSAEVCVSTDVQAWSDLETGENGIAAVEHFPAGLEGVAEARKEGFAASRHGGWKVPRDGSLEIVLRLSRGGAIEGKVIGKDGLPKADFELSVWGGAPGESFDPVTGPDGVYSVPHLAPGTYMLRVVEENPDWNFDVEKRYLWTQRRRVQVEEGRTTRVDFDMRLRGTLAGRLCMDRCPLSKQAVLLHAPFHELGFSHRSYLVSPEGSFKMDDLSPGTYDLTFWIGDWRVEEHPEPHPGVFLRVSGWLVEVQDGQLSAFDEALPEGGSVRGRLAVAGSTETPPRTQVCARGAGCECDVWSDEEGRFFFPYLVPGEYKFTLAYTGGLDFDPPPGLKVVSGKAVEDLVITLKKG